MKAAIFRGLRSIEVTDVPVPSPGPGEVLLKVRYCGICGSDVDAYRTGMYEPGIIIGHELAGEIVQVGEGVHGWEVGDRVTVNGVIPCGACWFCHHGRPSLCEDMAMTGITFHGAFAEFMVAPARGLYRLPDAVSDRQAALVDPLATALHAVRRSSLKPGDRVLILGGGPIGLLTLQCALVAGARAVYVSELSATRRDLAQRLGATAVFDPRETNLYVALDELTEGRGPDIVFECAGVPTTLQDAMTLVRKGGQIMTVGICEEPVAADFMTTVLNELEIRGAYCGYEEYPMALDYLAQGRVDVEPLISHVIALEEIVERGFEVLAAGEPQAVKVLVELR